MTWSMANKILKILLQIFSIVIILVILYILSVFFFPDFSDKYGDSDINAKIRNIKNMAFSISSPDGSLNLPF